MLKKRVFKTKDEVEIIFEHQGQPKDTVALVAEFNNWQPVAMSYSQKLKTFRTSVRLPKDSHFQFRYLVNEQQWQNDHAADNYLANGFGSDNCVVSTFAN